MVEASEALSGTFFDGLEWDDPRAKPTPTPATTTRTARAAPTMDSGDPGTLGPRRDRRSLRYSLSESNPLRVSRRALLAHPPC